MLYLEDTVSTIGKQLINEQQFASTFPTRLVMTVEDQNIRYRYDGGMPTAANGHLVFAGGTLVLSNAAFIRQLRLAATTGTARLTMTLE